MSLAELEILMERAPFEAPTVPHLETYVQAQLLAQQPFHMASCHLLLKNYQVHTKLCKPEYVANVLVLALMRLPSPDFLSLSYMIPCTVADHPQIVCVRNCANYLERAKFKEFWIEYSSAPQSLFSAAFGFVGAIRSYILSCLANTFKNIPQALFLELLGLPQVEINAFIAAAPRALQIVENNIVFQSESDTQPIQKYDETLKVEEVLRVVDSIRLMK